MKQLVTKPVGYGFAANYRTMYQYAHTFEPLLGMAMGDTLPIGWIDWTHALSSVRIYKKNDTPEGFPHEAYWIPRNWFVV